MEKPVIAFPGEGTDDAPRSRAAGKFPGPLSAVSTKSILDALALTVVVIDAGGAVQYVNGAGEQFFHSGVAHLEGRRLEDLLPNDSPLFALIEQVRRQGMAVSEHGVTLQTPHIGSCFVNLRAAPLGDDGESVVLTIHERSIADQIDRQLSHRGAARSVAAMAAIMAHEVKNPLSGIRGAAQLLEGAATPEDRPLTILIREEADRICALVDSMDMFSEGPPLRRQPVNIHKVLDRVRRLAENGFARHLRIREEYDPSLPPVIGNQDQLVQAFLNLVKNAAEAAPEVGGEVVLTTAYRPGVRYAAPGGNSRAHLPLLVSVRDNGDGIPENIGAHLFDPFVTSKPSGKGLGLALVAKIIDDHGGLIEYESTPRRTVFTVLLPVHMEGETAG